MKKVILSIIFSLCSISAFSHPPTNIDIQVKENTVAIVVSHNVNDPKTHYIKTIEVALNGLKIIEQSFSIQFDKDVQKATYYIPSLKKGDSLSVDADCNQFGDLRRTITIE